MQRLQMKPPRHQKGVTRRAGCSDWPTGVLPGWLTLVEACTEIAAGLLHSQAVLGMYIPRTSLYSGEYMGSQVGSSPRGIGCPELYTCLCQVLCMRLGC